MLKMQNLLLKQSFFNAMYLIATRQKNQNRPYTKAIEVQVRYKVNKQNN